MKSKPLKKFLSNAKISFQKQAILFVLLISLSSTKILLAQNPDSTAPVIIARNNPLTKAQVKFTHHDKVKAPTGQAKHVSSPYVQLYANTKYYILVNITNTTSGSAATHQIALYKNKKPTTNDCFQNECWQLFKKYSGQTNLIEDTFRFSEDVKLLITSWPMGIGENSSCEVAPTTQGEGLKFIFSRETNDMFRIAKTPLKLR